MARTDKQLEQDVEKAVEEALVEQGKPGRASMVAAWLWSKSRPQLLRMRAWAWKELKNGVHEILHGVPHEEMARRERGGGR